MKGLLKPFFRKEAPHLKMGRWGEKQAEKFLKKKGYKILGRRVCVGKHDEIDLIARPDKETIVFVEVKTRKNEEFGRPFAAVNREKKKRLSRAAVAYIKHKNLHPPYIRFDVVEVVGEKGGVPRINHIENAFQLEGNYRIFWAGR